MAEPFTFSEILLQCRPESATMPIATLEELLSATVRQAADAWPALQLDPETFVRHMARHWTETMPLERWLASVHLRDLYLAAACAEADPVAMDVFERHFMSQVPRYLKRFRTDHALVDDVCQTVRERLFVSAPGARAKIAEYSGRGPLERWLRVMSIRTNVDFLRRRGGMVGDPDGEREHSDGAQVDPELELVKRRYQRSFNVAVRDAIETLPSEQRDLLRKHFLQGATFEALAQERGVSRATIVRRMVAARQAVLEETERLLHQRLALAGGELESLFRLVRSQIDVSLSDCLH
jgi:RNA polymerase sigma-70 factor (ECF subfamily)